MGESLFRPPNVGGWKGGRTWANAGAYLIRINIALSIVTQPPRSGDLFRWDISKLYENRSFGSRDELIDFLFDRFHIVTPAAALRDSLRGVLTAAGEPFTWGSSMYDYFGRAVLFLLMASPDYQVQ